MRVRSFGFALALFQLAGCGSDFQNLGNDDANSLTQGKPNDGPGGGGGPGPGTVPGTGAPGFGKLSTLDARKGHAMAALGSEVVLFGGFGARYEDDTWIWNGSQWRRIDTPVRPSPRMHATMTSYGGRVLLFGGLGPGPQADPDDTWEFDGTTWHLLSPAHHPPAGRPGSMTEVDGKVLFFFTGYSAAPSATWQWDGSDWTVVDSGSIGAARLGTIGGKAYALFRTDAAGDGITRDRTLQWSGASWVELSNVPSPGLGGGLYPLAPWGDRLLTTGTRENPGLWQFDGAVWTKEDAFVGLARREAHAFASAGGSFVAFGGGGVLAEGDLNETFVWKGGATQVVPSDGPPGEGRPLMAQVGSNLVLVTGHTGYTAPQTWHWNGSKWSKATASGVPDFPDVKIAARDATHATAFGYRLRQSLDPLPETYEYDGTTWTRKSPTTSPTYQDFSIAGLNGKVYLLGWPLQGAMETWEWDGLNWKKLAPATLPTPRFSSLIATFGSRIVLFGGTKQSAVPSNQAYGNDTWEFDGSTWTQRATTSSPPGRVGGVMATVGSELLLLGGVNEGGVVQDAWAWNGTAWTKRASVPAAPRSEGALASFGSNGVLFGGGASSLRLSDTWIIAP
jgi:N-acetylneuraminic acid mutarotase